MDTPLQFHVTCATDDKSKHTQLYPTNYDFIYIYTFLSTTLKRSSYNQKTIRFTDVYMPCSKLNGSFEFRNWALTNYFLFDCYIFKIFFVMTGQLAIELIWKYLHFWTQRVKLYVNSLCYCDITTFWLQNGKVYNYRKIKRPFVLRQ